MILQYLSNVCKLNYRDELRTSAVNGKRISAARNCKARFLVKNMKALSLCVQIMIEVTLFRGWQLQVNAWKTQGSDQWQVTQDGSQWKGVFVRKQPGVLTIARCGSNYRHNIYTHRPQQTSSNTYEYYNQYRPPIYQK